MMEIIWLSVVTAAISFTITETKLFLSFRNWIKSKNRFLGNLFSCGYCLGFWISFGLTAIYRPRLFEAWWLLDYFCTALVIAWFSAFQWGILCWLFSKTGK
jgi:hypothetical protein